MRTSTIAGIDAHGRGSARDNGAMTFDHTLREMALSGDATGARTLADQVAIDLHRGILRGEFAGGSQLKINELAERYETSAMPIREALRRLTALGMVEIQPHRGARVLPLSLEDMRDTMMLRLSLEPLAVERAAAAFGGEVATEATAALSRMESGVNVGDRASARIAHSDFHLGLYRASGSHWLVRLIEPLWHNADRYRFAYPLSDDDQEQSNHEHREILAACLIGDAARAGEAMRSHLERSMKRVEALLIEAQHATSAEASDDPTSNQTVNGSAG